MMDEDQMMTQVRGLDARVKKLDRGAFLTLTVWPRKYIITLHGDYKPTCPSRNAEGTDCLSVIAAMSGMIDEIESKILSVEKLAQTLGVTAGEMK